MDLQNEWDHVVPPHEALVSAETWCKVWLSLSEDQLAALSGYAGNLWRAETGWVAATPSGIDSLSFLAPAPVYTSIFEAFAVGRGARSPLDQAHAFLLALDELVQEGVSEQWINAVGAAIECWQTAYVVFRHRVEYALFRFTTTPVQSRRPAHPPYSRLSVELLSVHWILKSSDMAQTALHPSRHW